MSTEVLQRTGDTPFEYKSSCICADISTITIFDKRDESYHVISIPTMDLQLVNLEINTRLMQTEPKVIGSDGA